MEETKTICRQCQTLKPLDKLFACASCNDNPCLYCSPQCQKAHWKFHQEYCDTAYEKKTSENQNISLSIEQIAENLQITFLTVSTQNDDRLFNLQKFVEYTDYKTDKTLDFYQAFNDLNELENEIIKQNTQQKRRLNNANVAIVSNPDSESDEETEMNNNNNNNNVNNENHLVISKKNREKLQNLQEKLTQHPLYKIYLFIKSVNNACIEPIPQFFNEEELSTLSFIL